MMKLLLSIGVIGCLSALVLVVEARPKGHHGRKQMVPGKPQNEVYENRNKGKQAKLDKEKNAAPSPERAEPAPEGIPPQAVEVKVQEHPKKQEKEKEMKDAGEKDKAALQAFPLKGSQQVPAKDKAKNKKKYPAYQGLQGQVPIEGPPQYPPVEQKISPPLPETIKVGKPESTTPSNAPNSNASPKPQAPAEEGQQEGRPQQKSKVHKKSGQHHSKHH